MATPPTRSQPEPLTGNRTESLPDAAERIPAVTIHVFCDTEQVDEAVKAAGADRRMSRAHLSVAGSGIAAAVDLYRREPSPHLIVVEDRSGGETLIDDLERLAEVCESSSKVVVIGSSNDVRLYRELLDRGVSDYLLTPAEPRQLVRVIGGLFREDRRVGRVCAFVGAKGGVGSSTCAHNVARALGQELRSQVILADLDMAFGTAGLDFNVDAASGVAEAVEDANRLDEVLLERLLAKQAENMSLLVAPAVLERAYDFAEDKFDRLLDIMQAAAPFVVLDVPNVWTAWARKTLFGADEVVITAEPDLASLRNAKNLVALLTRERPNDPPPRLVLNQVGIPKRPEIKPDEFAAALQLEPTICMAFDPAVFGAAANKGRMIGELLPKSRPAQCFAELARVLAGRAHQPAPRKSLFRPASWWRS